MFHAITNIVVFDNAKILILKLITTIFAVDFDGDCCI